MVAKNAKKGNGIYKICYKGSENVFMYKLDATTINHIAYFEGILPKGPICHA